MFLFHETTQRRVCRALFVIGGLLPLLLTLGWIAHWHRPWRQSDFQQALANQLYVRAEIDQVSAPRPNVLAFANLRLADLRTGTNLGAFANLQSQFQDHRQLIAADHLRLQADQLSALVDTFATWLATQKQYPLEIKVDRVTITSSQLQVIELENLRVSNDLSHPERRVFHLAANNQGKAIQLDIQHHNGNLQANLDLQNCGLPAWFIGKMVPGLAGCNDAWFTGYIKMESSDQHTRGNLQGQLKDVDLQQWTAAIAPHRLQCQSQVQLEQLTWTDAVIEIVKGSIQSSPGAASYSVFHSLKDPRVIGCAEGLELKKIKPATWDELIPFEKIAFRFHLSRAGVVLRGECDQGAMIVSPTGPLIHSPLQESPVPVANVVQLFHRSEKGWLPDTRGALNMARGLPLPGSEDSSVDTTTK